MVIRGPDRVLRIPPDDVIVPICQVDLEHGEERVFEKGYHHQRVRHDPPSAQRGLQPEMHITHLSRHIDELNREVHDVFHC